MTLTETKEKEAQNGCYPKKFLISSWYRDENLSYVAERLIWKYILTKFYKVPGQTFNTGGGYREELS